jgi:hypothetical protein
MGLLAGCIGSALLSGTRDCIDVASVVLKALCGTPARLLGFFLGLNLRGLSTHLSSTRQGPVHFSHGKVSVLTSTGRIELEAEVDYSSTAQALLSTTEVLTNALLD